MLTVHHLDDSRSQRILWLLEELEIPYEIERHFRDPATNLAPDALKEVHPLGKAPVIEDDGQVVAESGAIVEYIIDVHGGGRLRPERGAEAFERYRYWMHYAEGSAMFPLVLTVIFEELVRQSPLPAKPVMKMVSKAVNDQYISGEIRKHMRHWERHLAGHEWFAGEEMTGADILMSFPCETAMTRADVGDYPNMCAFVERVHSREAYQRALDVGGACAYA